MSASMLKKSLILGGKSGPQLLNKQHQPIASSQLQHQIICTVARRLVATTSSSKTNQVARQRKVEHDSEDGQHDLTSSSVEIARLNKENYRARMENLDLWHSVDTIKRLGHRLAQLDPLQMRKPESLQELSWSHKLIESLRDNQSKVSTQAFLATKQPLMATNELIETVWSIYANSHCGLEFSHMTNQTEVEWLTSQWERLNEMFHLDKRDERNLAKLLIECEAFDHFMAAKYPATKRYGCEGAEPMLLVFDEILRLCQLGEADVDELTDSLGRIDDLIIGMPHRGRLNLLACLLGFEPSAIFNKTRGEPELDLREAWMAKGDVLSHLSTNLRFVYGLDRQHIGLSRDTPDPINVTLLPNPSHLEISSPMVAGAARGRAHNLLHSYSSSPKLVANGNRHSEESTDYTQHFANILPIQVHGDAAIAGQGIIQETLQMANLDKFTVGGSLHLVVNNQIGYTTDSSLGRSSRHCTDIFKLIEAPIIHVNGQDIASVIRAIRLALTYRQRFGKDVAINLICYRQHGHNELDEPSFTQPLMYERIRKRTSIPQQFCDQIGLDPQKRLQIATEFKEKLSHAHKQLDKFKPDNDNYRNFSLPSEFHRDHICSWQTGFDLELLRSIALASVDTPAGFKLHPNLERVLVGERRRLFGLAKTAAELANCKVDWATAEMLAFGSLLRQNHSVRIAGQDVARGTFSTRHAVLFDQLTGQPFVPLNEMPAEMGCSPEAKDKLQHHQLRAKLEVANTILSEEAALAYEFAYSAETCELAIWEAQFGDFFNTAQSVIDTLVSSSESKWLKQSALTLLLPHGLDGAGPEHSSSHLERFLQLSSSSMSADSIDTEAKVNWSVCFPTLPSQYFHLLRRQIIRPFRKPLVIMSPKVIFRHPRCASRLADLGEHSSFQPVLDDPSVGAKHKGVDKIVLCSGKVYFMLEELKTKSAGRLDNVAVIRIEELCPFPIQSLVEIIRSYPNVKRHNLYWLQEEHKNQGAYGYVDVRLANLANIRANYIGRAESELPATGSSSMHKKELEQIVRQFEALAN